MTTDRGRHTKLSIDRIEKDVNTARRNGTRSELPRAMALSRHLPHAVMEQRGVVEAILPVVPSRERKRVKRELTLDTSHIACSLDFLAAIANEQARFEAAIHEEPSDQESYDDNTPDNDDIDELMKDDDEDSLCGESPDEQRPSAEEDAAAALLMASLMQHCQAPRKRRRADSDQFEGGALRSRRLSQNQLYRKRLQDKGVRPIRKGPKQYACSLCSEIFEKEMFVWRHGVKHLESKPFQCSLCGGRFNRSDSLQRHVRNFHKKI